MHTPRAIKHWVHVTQLNLWKSTRNHRMRPAPTARLHQPNHLAGHIGSLNLVIMHIATYPCVAISYGQSPERVAGLLALM